MKRFFRDNALTIVLFGLFFVTLAGQSATGWKEYNQDRTDHKAAGISYSKYLGSGHFIEGVFENWESEFLQMSAYVLLTIWLRQKGSAESKKVTGEEPVDKDPSKSRRKNAPWPVRKGGLVLKLYENSLSLAFIALFLLSFGLHAIGGRATYNVEQREHGGHAISTMTYLRTSRFWYESLQNWQSEFLATGSIVLFSVFLRQRGSPESKPVDAPHSQTGE
jgi:hypothetical protein